MKTKKIITFLVVAIATGLVGIKASEFQKSNSVFNEILLANVEALANDSEDATITCSRSCGDGIGRCWDRDEANSMPGHNYCYFEGHQWNSCVCNPT